ncbi:MAG: hypothetical protein AAGA56_30605, partial [Myxococcota bacterium]
IGRLQRGAWQNVRTVAEHPVTAHMASEQGEFVTTAHDDEGCTTQLWRWAQGGLKRAGGAVAGARAWLLADEEGWPILVTSAAVMRWKPSGATTEPLDEEEVSDARMVSGKLWVSTRRGWLSQREYGEVGSPEATCATTP